MRAQPQRFLILPVAFLAQISPITITTLQLYHLVDLFTATLSLQNTISVVTTFTSGMVLSIAFAVVGVSNSRAYRRRTMTSRITRTPLAPVLITDILDTIVVDPFFNGMASHFGFSQFDAFLKAKTPNLWVQFERGEVEENILADNFFRDGRKIDVDALKQFLKNSYHLVPGVDDMLFALRGAGIEIHACTNYPIWADLVEDALQLESTFGLKWTFVSAREGCRKPEKRAYLRTAEKAQVDASDCILLDDKKVNCDGAIEAGYRTAIHFQNANQAMEQLEKVYADAGVTLQFNSSCS